MESPSSQATTMSDASSTSSRSTVTRGHGKRLSEEEIRDILYNDDAMDDDLDYDPEKDLTQRSDTSEGKTQVDDVASAYGIRSSPGLSHRPGSTPLSPPPSSLFPYNGDDMADMEYFQAYFDNVFMRHLVTETNMYAHTLIDSGILPALRLTRWKATTIDEMHVFLALCMMMKHSEKAVVQDYWNKDSLVPSPVFNRYVSRDKFHLILGHLHFENNANEDRRDRLWKVRKVFSDLRGNFRDYFVPGQNVVIDELLVLFKGRLAFKQYIPSKRHCFGLKFFMLCDCETGIVLDMIL
ncbi:piggyBac transposable element-derived protein 4-like [Procambarus clarkii]|uniref:piggyBac transposable element-derived protein 4-like n=1 Tax=Procambarus clarkii TaxID=6728 RepID=UPI003743C1AF